MDVVWTAVVDLSVRRAHEHILCLYKVLSFGEEKTYGKTHDFN